MQSFQESGHLVFVLRVRVLSDWGGFICISTVRTNPIKITNNWKRTQNSNSTWKQCHIIEINWYAVYSLHRFYPFRVFSQCVTMHLAWFLVLIRFYVLHNPKRYVALDSEPKKNYIRFTIVLAFYLNWVSACFQNGKLNKMELAL